MNLTKFNLAALIFIIFVSCSSTNPTRNSNKNSSTEVNKEDALYNKIWELEYITGPRIAFEGLFPDQKPHLLFNRTTNIVSGNAGCNGYSSNYTLQNKNLKFGEREISTLMYCGEGETQFVNFLKEIDGYLIDAEGKLNLLTNNVTMMRFHKNNQL